jgi:hypothetical protein
MTMNDKPKKENKEPLSAADRAMVECVKILAELGRKIREIRENQEKEDFMNAINPSLLTVSPSLLCQLLLAAMEGAATMPEVANIQLSTDEILFLRRWIECNPESQVRAWALNELRRAQP